MKTHKAAKLYKHNYNTNELLENNELFADFVDPKKICIDSEVEGYNYDFSVDTVYEYEIPYSAMGKTVAFLQEGNDVDMPVDFIESVSITREELYD